MIFRISVVELDDVDELKTLFDHDKKIVVTDPERKVLIMSVTLEKDIALV